MPAFHLLELNRQEYLDSVENIADPKSIAFAAMSLAWWDRHFNWSVDGCVVLSNPQGEHLCYVFYKIDRYKEYINIHNIFTPLVSRRQGHAQMLIAMIFDLALTQHVRRFKLSSISKSLDFYLALGFVYWGINSVGDYYCDLPLPKAGLSDLNAMVLRSTVATLMGNHEEKIFNKIDKNIMRLSEDRLMVYTKDTQKMGAHYLNKHLYIPKETHESI